MPGQGNEVIIEFHRIGASVKVSAMDTAPLTEVSMAGLASASEAQLTQAVIKKLEYVMAKNKG
jgi:hypothetical protein